MILRPFMQDPLDRGLVGDWRDPVTGLELPDYSGYGLHGEITGADWIASRFGPVLSFNGSSDHVDCGTNDVLDGLSDAITIEALVQLGAATTAHIACKEYDIFFRAAGASPQLQLGLDISGVKYAKSVNDALVVSTWHHVAGTYRSGDSVIQLWIDGSEPSYSQQDSTGGGTIATNTDPILIARRKDGYYFGGDIGYVRMYNRALSAAEIQASYQRCLARASAMKRTWMIPYLVTGAAPAGAIMNQLQGPNLGADLFGGAIQ